MLIVNCEMMSSITLEDKLMGLLHARQHNITLTTSQPFWRQMIPRPKDVLTDKMY